MYDPSRHLCPRRGARNRQIGVHPVLIIASALDPRTKELSFVTNQETKNAIWNFVLSIMEGMAREIGTNTEDDEESIVVNNDAETAMNIFELMDAEEAEAEARSAESDELSLGGTRTATETDCKSEIRRYKQAQRLSFTKDPLQWWKQNEFKFPLLAKVARRYLSIQPTSAPSERVFSKASRLLSSKRIRMDPMLAGKAFFVSENWDWFEKQVDIAKKLDDIEMPQIDNGNNNGEEVENSIT